MARRRINDLASNPDTTRDKITEMTHLETGLEPPCPVVADMPAKSKRGKSAITFLSQGELQSLFAAIDASARGARATRLSVRDRAIFSVAYRRGLRASEVGMLQMRDFTPATINERTGRLYVRRLKDSDSKLYQMTKPEYKDLRAWLRLRGEHEGPIFSSGHRQPISRQRLDALMKRYGKAAGIPRELRHFHTLKHSCGVHLLLAGLGVDQVQDWLGHRNIQNTMIYLRVANIRLNAAAEKLVNF
jgi:integrase